MTTNEEKLVLEKKDDFRIMDRVAYHLKAMDYAKLKLDSELSKIPSDRQKLEKGDLLKIINNQRELIRWYENQVEYHREKATAFIPNYAMRKVTQNREKENESLERLFVRGGC